MSAKVIARTLAMLSAAVLSLVLGGVRSVLYGRDV